MRMARAGAISELEIAVYHLVPGESLLAELLHEWIGIKLLDIPHAGLLPEPLRNIIAPIMAGTPVV